MVQPRLIHPVPVVIEQFLPSQTIVDDDFREPVQHAARAAQVTVDGQPKWGADESSQPTRGGVEEGSDGYVLFRYKDLDDAGVTLKRSDRFVSIGGLNTDVYITRLRPEGHYTDQGGPTLIKAFFADRQPSRQAE